MIVRARCALTMHGAPIEDAAVVVHGEKIAEVGTWREIRAHHGGETVDLGECILLPGLINAHCHLDYTKMRGLIPRQRSFTNWIRSINACKATWTDDDYLASIRDGIDEAARFGTTAIANLEAFPHLVSQLAPPAMRIRWFAEMIDVREAVSPPRDFDLAPHAPYTASAQLYSKAAELVRMGGRLATTHLAESDEEMRMFRDGAGPLFEFMKSLGRRTDDCGTRTPLALMLERGVLDEHWIVAHLNELEADDFALLRSAPKFHVVHCPRSHDYFGHASFRYEDLRDLGFNICLGTDSLASNDDLSLFAEMRRFSEVNPTIPAREILEMITTRAATALHAAHSLGQIRSGFAADLIAIPTAGKPNDAFENAFEFDGNVAWRMLHGQVAL